MSTQMKKAPARGISRRHSSNSLNNKYGPPARIVQRHNSMPNLASGTTLLNDIEPTPVRTMKRRPSLTDLGVGCLAGASTIASASAFVAPSSAAAATPTITASTPNTGHSEDGCAVGPNTSTKSHSGSSSLSSLKVMPDFDFNLLDFDLTATASVANMIVEASPQVESELFTDAAKSLDLVTSAFAGSLPTKNFSRLSTVIGRLCVILADYIPDHHISQGEMVFQGFMLTVASTLLARSCVPTLHALLSPVSFQEKKAYQALFRKFGLSWLQFKTIISLAGEWVEIPPDGQVNNSGEDGQPDVFWLQRGEVVLIVNDTPFQSVQAMEGELSLLGELDFARKLQKQITPKHTKKSRNKSVEEKNANEPLKSTNNDNIKSKIRAGPNGATLLRLDSSKLLRLMEHDDDLAEGMKSLIYTGMQEKLTKVMLTSEQDNVATQPVPNAA